MVLIVIVTVVIAVIAFLGECQKTGKDVRENGEAKLIRERKKIKADAKRKANLRF